MLLRKIGSHKKQPAEIYLIRLATLKKKTSDLFIWQDLNISLKGFLTSRGRELFKYGPGDDVKLMDLVQSGEKRIKCKAVLSCMPYLKSQLILPWISWPPNKLMTGHQRPRDNWLKAAQSFLCAKLEISYKRLDAMIIISCLSHSRLLHKIELCS